MPLPAPDGAARPRVEFAALHAIKAAAIVAVAVNHAGPFAFGSNFTEIDRVLRTRWVDFHVPSFVFVSGFLYQRAAAVPARDVLGRLARIVLPYLVASLLGIATGVFRPTSVGYSLATGSATGIYYYVFVMVCLIPLVWPISRVPVRIVGAVLAVLLLYQALAIARPGLLPAVGWFWGIRNPLLFAPCFLAGWLARAHLPRLVELARNRAGLVWATALATIVLYVALRDELQGGGARWIARYAYTGAVLAVLALRSAGRAVPRPVRALSDATLAIYLYHIMVYLGLGYLRGWPPPLRIPVLVALGLGCGLAVASSGRSLLGRASRWVTGA